MSYILRVAQHFVALQPPPAEWGAEGHAPWGPAQWPTIEWVADAADASDFASILDAAKVADALRITGYQVEPCPRL